MDLSPGMLEQLRAIHGADASNVGNQLGKSKHMHQAVRQTGVSMMPSIYVRVRASMFSGACLMHADV